MCGGGGEVGGEGFFCFFFVFPYGVLFRLFGSNCALRVYRISYLS